MSVPADDGVSYSVLRTPCQVGEWPRSGKISWVSGMGDSVYGAHGLDQYEVALVLEGLSRRNMAFH